MSSKKLLQECRVYWSNCEVWTNEVVCKFWRSSDAVSLLHTSEKYPLQWGLRLPTLSLPSLLANIPDIAQRQGFLLKEQTQKIYLEGMELRAISRILRVHQKTGFPLACYGY